MNKAIIIILILMITVPFNIGGCINTDNDTNAGEAIANLFSLEIIPIANQTSISLSGSKKTIELLLKGVYSDKSEKMIDAIRADWAPSNGTAGVISINGIFTAQKEGPITITATIGNIKDEVIITVIK